MRTTVSGYRLHRLVHRRQGRDLWLGQTPDRSRPVAIKQRAAPDARSGGRSLAEEADALGALGHPNVVTLIEFVDDPPDQVLVLSWVPGGSLRDLLDERGTLLPGELVALLLGVAGAVEHLQARGMVHGDLRPDHIVLNTDGNPVLVGFGAVTAAPAVTADRGAMVDLPASPQVGDRPGRIGGDIDDPAYLHPALAAGCRPDGRSAVFSLAVMAYECLTGRVPHRGTPAEVLALAAAGVHRPLSSWPSVPPGMAQAVEAGLVVDGPDVAFDDAPVHAGDFVARLRAAVDPATVVRPRPPVDPAGAATGPATDETLPFGPRPSEAAASPQNDVWRVAAAAVIVIVAVAGLWFLAGAVLGI